jgi:hypothetical protein
MIMIQQNSLVGVSSLLTSRELELHDVLLEKDYNGVLDGSVKYKNLIKCLIQCESSYNPNAIGDLGLSFGILQFQVRTFNYYSARYELDLEYQNPVHQIILCDLMLQEDYNNAFAHWTNCYLSCKRK